MIGYRYGGFWRRGAAILIDKLILYFLFMILVLLEFMVLPARPYSPYPDTASGIWGPVTDSFLIGHIIVFSLMGAVYFTYFHAATGQTPGKMLFKLKVLRTTGKSLTYGASFLRWACYIISVIFLYIGFIWAAFDSRKQAWHDKLADTLVILVNNDEWRTAPQQLTIKI
ncbi:MAG: RDD family protein [Syntrophales bacterium LBB04]|nr:RDD family protein [Syntrophales bacterium LBB04]